LFVTSRRHPWVHWLCLFSAALAISIGFAADTKTEKPLKDRLLEPLPFDRSADDVGRFLAGMPGRPDSPFAKYQDTPAWAKHKQEWDAAYQKMDTEHLLTMRAFQKSEFGSNPASSATVFYPFSGPDSLMVTVFFPQSPVYVLVALEPPGTLPAAKDFEKKNLDNYLASIRQSVSDVLDRSFFITRQMDRQFRGQVADGLCLPILELLVRSGHTILGFRYVRLDDKGQIIERPADYRSPGRNGNKGLEIEFRTDSDQSIHKMFYFSVNISNSYLAGNRPFMTFLSGLQGCTTYLKATSYMVHNAGFSTIRDRMLAESGAILQDDSGVPYHFFLTPNWRVQLYGEYVRPYGSFGWLEQPDLKKAYQTQNPKVLPFRIGYGFRAVPSNLLFATKIK